MERHAKQQIAKGHAKNDRWNEAAHKQAPVPGFAPGGIVDFAAVQTGLVGDNRTVAVDAVQVEVGSSPGRVAAVLGSCAVEARRLVANREVVVKSS